MNRVAAIAANVPRTCVRRISMTEARCEKGDLAKIKKKQLHFQTDNDIPVFIKGGPGDYMLYYGTLALVFIGAVKFLNCGKRVLRMANYKVLRMSSTDEPCSTKPPEPCPQKQQQAQPPPDPCACMKGEPPPKQEPCPPKQQEPCPPKPDPMPKPPSATKCSERPPCTAMPRCPATFCPHMVDRNNPCNYCPPVCIDPDYPDMTRIKKYQCLFQQDDGIPIHLKRGNLDALVYQTTLLLVILGVIAGVYSSVKLMMK